MENSSRAKSTENMNPHLDDLQSAVPGLRDENNELLKKIEELSNLNTALTYQYNAALHKYKSLEKKLEESEKKLLASLAYRLGLVVINCWKKPLSRLPFLPFFLLSEYSAYKKNKAKGQNKALRQNVAIRRLYTKAMGGFSRYAIPEMEELFASGKLPAQSRAYAAFLLCRWYIIKGQYEAAYACLQTCDNLPSKAGNWLRILCFKHLCLYHLGRHDEAMRLLEETMRERGRSPELLLMYASHFRLSGKYEDAAKLDAARLDAFNDVFERYGLLKLVKKNPALPFGIANLMPAEQLEAENGGEKVSVIMPVYNAEQALAYSIGGLLDQTWRNLEIIAVDDASTDGSLHELNRLAALDARIKVVHLEKNLGAYGARNKGLEQATGEYITIHDSDDWSHPQKIELQVKVIISNKAVASVSHLLRVNSHMEYVGFFTNKFKQENMSSLMFKREVPNFIGTWQQVRTSGDAEYIKRIQLLYGESSIVAPPEEPIVSFCRHDDNSLTSQSATSIFSLFHFSGLRYIHKAWYSNLHAAFDLGNDTPSTFFAQKPMPPCNRSERKESSAYDIIVVSDFTLPGGSMRSSLHYAVASKKAGLKVALYHWKKYEFNPELPINPYVFEVINEHGIDILSASDTASTNLLLVGFTALLSHIPNVPPRISARNAAVLVNQMAESLTNGDRKQYDPVSARKTMQDIFGLEGSWIPISGWVKRLMQSDPRYPEPWHEPWHPLMDVQSSAETLPRKCRGTRPVIGRHGRDSITKWPAIKENLEQAYCIGKDLETLFMGGADWAFKVLGYVPEQWQVLDFGALPSADFLEKLDFLVHFPHELYVEEFGRVVMEAMAAGVVAILPHQFKDTFGNAALYCEPEEVFPLVQHYWQNQELYHAQQLKAFAFVSASCDLSCFLPRLTRLLSCETTANGNKK